jgi:hypothetical protein
VATAAATFQQAWRIGRQVQELAAPHRKGSIRVRIGTGASATIIVNIPGGHPVSFRPAQLRLL